jgi:hypothetical protein
MPRLLPTRGVPWLMVLEGAFIARDHWKHLTPEERERLRELIRKSKGLPKNLTAREREEVKQLVSQLDVPGIGREMIPFVGKRRRRKR